MKQCNTYTIEYSRYYVFSRGIALFNVIRNWILVAYGNPVTRVWSIGNMNLSPILYIFYSQSNIIHWANKIQCCKYYYWCDWLVYVTSAIRTSFWSSSTGKGTFYGQTRTVCKFSDKTTDERKLDSQKRHWNHLLDFNIVAASLLWYWFIYIYMSNDLPCHSCWRSASLKSPTTDKFSYNWI